MTVVHNARLRERSARSDIRRATIDAIEMGVADPLGTRRRGCDGRRRRAAGGTSPAESTAGRPSTTRIPEDAIVLAAFGGMTPEKRIGPLVRALSAIAGPAPEPAPDARRRGGRALRRHGGRRAVARRRSRARHRLRRATRSCPPISPPRTSARACAGRPTARRRHRGCAASRPDAPRSSPSWRTWLTSRRSIRAAGGARRRRDSRRAGCREHRPPRRRSFAAARRSNASRPMPACARALGTAARAWWSAHHQLAAMADGYERVIARGGIAPGAAHPRSRPISRPMDDQRHARDRRPPSTSAR